MTFTVHGEPVADIVPTVRGLDGCRAHSCVSNSASRRPMPDFRLSWTSSPVRLSTSCDRLDRRAARHVRVHRA